MTCDEWREHKDFDELRCEMNGDFSRYRMSRLTTTDAGGFLSPKKKTIAQIDSDAPETT